jgi:hypothetical protein
MTTRTQRTVVSFKKPFSLPGVDGVQPAGEYVVETDDLLLEGVSSLAYRRIATLLHLPSIGVSKYARQHVSVNQADLEAALSRDQDSGP